MFGTTDPPAGYRVEANTNIVTTCDQGYFIGTKTSVTHTCGTTQFCSSESRLFVIVEFLYNFLWAEVETIAINMS